MVLFVCITVVFIKVRHRSMKKATKKSSNYKAIIRTTMGILGLTFLFGLTWLFAILTFSSIGFRETFQLLFTILNSFQGAFIFLFMCVLSSEAREGWKRMFRRKSTYHSKLSQYSSASKSNTYSSGSGKFNLGRNYSNPIVIKVNYKMLK